jgi:hypothetical protein
MARANGKIIFGNDQSLSDDQRLELRILVETLGRIQLVEDQEKAIEHMGKRVPFKVKSESLSP